MRTSSKLMDMLTEYAAAHQHPFNVVVHMLGIPAIMMGIAIVSSWAQLGNATFSINGAYIIVSLLVIFYMTLDITFSLAFLLLAFPIAYFATVIGEQPLAISGGIAAATFFGGYIAQFVGHAIEKSAPVVLKRPIQAHVAAPFFMVVEFFKICGLRDALFNEVQARLGKADEAQAPHNTIGV